MKFHRYIFSAVLRKTIYTSFYLGITCFFVFFLLNLLFPLHYEISWSSIITDRDGKILHTYLTDDDKWRLFTEIEQISPELESAIVHKEDRWFYLHPGINPVAALRAAVNNINAGTRTSGASTIHMQVARMLNPRPRTYRNKIIEMFRALQLNMLHSKKEVLQLYLNLVPYGGNIEGVRAASLLYLDKSPEQLSPAEITAFSIIPNRPGSLQPGKENEALVIARNKWLKRFGKEGVFSVEDVVLALKEPFSPVRRAAPATAPHISRRLRNENPEARIVVSTIQTDLQIRAEQLVSNYMPGIRSFGIHNAAVMVVDNNNAEVLAYVGSADFFDASDGGQVDGLQAIRSPGSTLKPILFGLAMDSGMVTPKSVLLDVPIDFDGYRPQNFDRTCRGKINAEKSLALSLNIPAVRMLDLFGVEPFRRALQSAGCSSMEKQKGQLGLSMILGGCGISAEELAAVYSGIANDGLCRPLKLTTTAINKDTVRIFSPGAAWAVGDLLTGLRRPDFPLGFEYSADLPKVAWKTGTSYGRRDAWSVGFNSRYTILVWTGNFSGEGIPELTGAGIAAPLLFDLFQSLDRTSGKTWKTAPASIQYRYVCAQSGLLPDTFCHDQVLDVFIPMTSSFQKCRHLRNIFLRSDSSYTYCQSCLPESGYKEAMWPDYAPELISWYRDQQIGFEELPGHNPECERLFAGDAPAILSPTAGLVYYMYAGSGKLELSCQAEAGVKQVYWYIGDRFYKAADPKEKLYFEPEPGKTKISCTDDKGRNRDSWVEVMRF